MKEIAYYSTRGFGPVTASEAILTGLAPDGGLFVPDRIPALPLSLGELSRLSYPDLAYEILHAFLTDFSEEELRACCAGAYDEKFDTPEIAPLAKVGDVYYLELYHGKTIAFKDMALSILPHLMTAAAARQQDRKEIVILTATSGDTGKAALAGFANVPGTRIAVFYPHGGVSPIQERQMVTQEGENTCVIAVRGNFDDAQTGVKQLLGDEALREELDRRGMRFSSANSINIGRLVPQIAYYVHAYARLLREGEIREGDPVNFTVPTGNFGNILAAYYAKKMGLPVGKLICASNRNRVLFDFFSTGTYDRRRPFYLTTSPSMDILISSNLERLVYELGGEDAGKDRDLMARLTKDGTYELTPDMKEKLTDFAGGYADEEQTAAEIARVWNTYQYLLDPHTAVASSVYQSYRKETGDDTPTVVVSTASPFKFTGTVMGAVCPGVTAADDFALADRMAQETGWPVPAAVNEVRSAPVRHRTVCDISAMKENVLAFLK